MQDSSDFKFSRMASVEDGYLLFYTIRMKKLITVRISLITTLLIMMAPPAIKASGPEGRGGPPAPPASPEPRPESTSRVIGFP